MLELRSSDGRRAGPCGAGPCVHSCRRRKAVARQRSVIVLSLLAVNFDGQVEVQDNGEVTYEAGSHGKYSEGETFAIVQ